MYSCVLESFHSLISQSCKSLLVDIPSLRCFPQGLGHCLTKFTACSCYSMFVGLMWILQTMCYYVGTGTVLQWVLVAAAL